MENEFCKLCAMDVHFVTSREDDNGDLKSKVSVVRLFPEDAITFCNLRSYWTNIVKLVPIYELSEVPKE